MQPPHHTCHLSISAASVSVLVGIFSSFATPAAAQRCTTLNRAGCSGMFMFVSGSRQALRLVRYDVELAITHPVAETTITQEFENPTSRMAEAYFHYALPPDATLTDLALWVNGKRRPARVLERQKAREIYRGIVNRKRDPALVERLAGNLFRIRIFPVMPKRRTRVQLSFAQPVKRIASGRYRLRLRRPPGARIDVLRLGISLRAPFSLRQARLSGARGSLRGQAGRYALPLSAARQTFEKDIVLEYQARTVPSRPVVAVTRGNDGKRYFVAELPRAAGAAAPRLAILLDTSASMKAHLPRACALARRLIAALPRASDLQLVPFDYLPRVEAGDASSMASATKQHISRVHTLLAQVTARRGSAFAPVIESVLSGPPRRAWGASSASHIVLITDGASARHQAELEHVLRRVHDQGRTAVSVLLLNPRAATAELLRDIAKQSGGRFYDAAKLGSAALRQLAALTPPPAPRSKAGPLLLLRAGTEHLLIAGRAEAGVETVHVDLVGRSRVELILPQPNSASAARALWAAARIDALYRRIKLFGEDEPLRQRIVALSKAHRVASEYTAFLVTENDAQYRNPTSGRTWQRRVARLGDAPTPSFHSTPEPHEWAMILLGLIFVMLAQRRRGGLFFERSQ